MYCRYMVIATSFLGLALLRSKDSHCGYQNWFKGSLRLNLSVWFEACNAILSRRNL